MTRKDYVLIADTLANLTLSLVAEELATALETDNPRFNRARFLDACGVK
jgi:hypothetical protein